MNTVAVVWTVLVVVAIAVAAGLYIGYDQGYEAAVPDDDTPLTASILPDYASPE